MSELGTIAPEVGEDGEDVPNLILDAIVFPISDLASRAADLETRISSACEERDLFRISNLPAETVDAEGNVVEYEPPANSLYCVYPMFEQIKGAEKADRLIGYLEVILPNLDALMSTEKGLEYVTATCLARMRTKLESAVKRAINESIDPENIMLPIEVADLISRQTSKVDDSGWKEFDKVAVQVLKQKGVKITRGDLRRVLSSQHIASTRFPKVQSETWQQLIAILIKLCQDQEPPVNYEIFEHWLQTRETVDNVVEEIELDFNEGDLLAAE